MISEQWEQGEPIAVPWRVLPDYQCFGCSPHNDSGLALSFRRVAQGIACRLQFDRRHESYPGRVHGGILSTVCDEIMGNLLVLESGMCVLTTTLRTRYISALSVGVEYWCLATADGAKAGGPLYQARADVMDAGGDPLVSAVGQYHQVPLTGEPSPTELGEAETRLIEAELAKLRTGH